MWWVYQVTCATPNHYYVGITQDPAHRFRQHAKKQGSAFTKRHGYEQTDILAQSPTEKVAKLAEKLAVGRLRSEGKVACGSGWSWE